MCYGQKRCCSATSAPGMHAITQVCRLAGQLASVCYLLVSLQAELRSCSIQALQLRQPAPAAYATLANAQAELPVTCKSSQFYADTLSSACRVLCADAGAALALLSAGYNIDTLLTKYQGMDWWIQRNWGCNSRCARVGGRVVVALPLLLHCSGACCWSPRVLHWACCKGALCESFQWTTNRAMPSSRLQNAARCGVDLRWREHHAI